MNQVKANILSNLAGQGWSTLVSLLAIPLYLRFMGAEAYGLVGLFSTLTVLVNLLDMGLSLTINREMARYSGQPDRAQEMRDLARTLEYCYWGIGLVIGITVVVVAPFIARHWVRAQALPPAVVQQTVTIMGLLAAVQWPLSFYAGGLLGLQQQVILNTINIGSSLLAAGGALLILWLVSPTVTAFFAWQVISSTVQTSITVWAFWRFLPRGDQCAQFRQRLLRSVWSFAAGMSGITLFSLILTQMDKILLSRMLTLEKFGYYMLASVVARILYSLIGPLFSALFPRFAECVVAGDHADLRELYHTACQWASVIILPAALVLVFFAPELLRLWTHNPVAVANTHLLVRLLVIGNALHGLATLPYALQLAYGWTTLSLYTNIIACIILLPGILLSVTWYGGIGAAATWIMVASTYCLIAVPLMHRRVLCGDQWRWFVHDVGLPLVSTVTIVGGARAIMGADLPPIVTTVWLTAVYALATGAGALLSPKLRTWALDRIRWATT